MNIIKFILLNWDSVVLVIAAAGGVVALIIRGETKILEAILFRHVTDAERDYGGGTGELKKSAVIEWIYDKIPAAVKPFITRRRLEKLVDKVLKYAKAKWAANPQLREYINPTPAAPTDAEK